MFRKARTIINGIELPEEFSGSSVINNIAISPRGRFAYVKDGNIITGDIPDDGKLDIDGNVLTIKKGIKDFNIGSMSAGRRIFSTGSISIGSSDIQVGSSSISIGRDKQYEIDEVYNNAAKVTLKDSANDIHLLLSKDNSVSIKGLTDTKPEFKDKNLFIDGLEGTLGLPKNVIDLEVNIRTSAGDIEGDIAHKGRLRTSAGDIDLELYAPLILEISTSAGDINVEKMISNGKGIFIPPNAKPIGTLVIETSSGDVNVKYIWKKDENKEEI